MNSDPTLSGNLQSVPARRAWVSLGGNLAWNGLIGAPLFEAALRRLGDRGLRIVSASTLWTGPAWPNPTDPSFFNAVAEGHWFGAPEDLMALLLETEAVFGRVRSVKNAARTLDLDLLSIEGVSGEFAGGLTLPHPRLTQRAFILGPLAEVSPDWGGSACGRSARVLFDLIENKGIYRSINTNRLRF